ncbi:MAG: cob(I)yrinic acid a,c-diamide adenosyltransferase, partial [Oscillospiraceae bacterium]|nr:cob(I)yrinic acid a,c-diamide adenosyltransferase [Oscillospiraceae bacterium]
MALTHIYCGNGKGKTTAALGLAMRASGAGMKVHIVQLIKGSDTSELSSISQLSNITVVRPPKNYGFTRSM